MLCGHSKCPGFFRHWTGPQNSLHPARRRIVLFSSTSHQRGGPHPSRLDPPTKSTWPAPGGSLDSPLLPFMGEIPLGTDIHPEPPPTATTSTIHRRLRTRSRITTLDIDLVNALSVAPAPHSWKDAEERVLSEFGDSLPAQSSVDGNGPSLHKEYFVDDLKYVSPVRDRSIHS